MASIMTRYQSLQQLDKKEAFEATLLLDIGVVLAEILSRPDIDEPSPRRTYLSNCLGLDETNAPAIIRCWLSGVRTRTFLKARLFQCCQSSSISSWISALKRTPKEPIGLAQWCVLSTAPFAQATPLSLRHLYDQSRQAFFIYFSC